MLFSWPLVSVLRGTTGSYEPAPITDRAGESIVDRDFTPDGSAVILHGGPTQAALSFAQRCREPSRGTVRAGLSRARRPAGHLPALLCQSAFCQWRQQLGTTHPGDLHRRPRWHDSLCIRRRGLYPAAGASGNSAVIEHTPVKHSLADFNYDWIWVSLHFGVPGTSAAGSTS